MLGQGSSRRGFCVRILIFEDEAIIAFDMSEMLRSIGHDVVGVARDVSEALSLAKSTRPELALVDYALPHGDNGITLTRILRSLWRIPSLFVSANPDDCRDAAGQDGVLGCLAKPFTENDLRIAVDVADAIINGRTPPPPPANLQMYSYIF
jgi:CheY-like chemotaxis protein